MESVHRRMAAEGKFHWKLLLAAFLCILLSGLGCLPLLLVGTTTIQSAREMCHTRMTLLYERDFVGFDMQDYAYEDILPLQYVLHSYHPQQSEWRPTHHSLTSTPPPICSVRFFLPALAIACLHLCHCAAI